MSKGSNWLRGAALYQIYPLSFLDRNGDGWGDLDGVLDGIDHVASLGVDGVWISPFYPSPLRISATTSPTTARSIRAWGGWRPSITSFTRPTCAG